MSLGKVLVVDDDNNICELLKLYLEKEGYGVIISHDGEEAVVKFNALKPDVVLLDIMLPELDGWQVCREIRKKSNVPIIMITAKSETFDKVLGLELGADDYIIKPFEMLELTARVEAVLRRTKKDTKVFELENIRVELDSRLVYCRDKPVYLTPKEYELLDVLITNRNIALSRDRLLELIWAYDFNGDSRTVDVHIQKLRKKLGWENRIKTVYKLGYRLETRK